MLLSPQRRAHSAYGLQEFNGFQRSTYQKWCFGRIHDYAGAAAMLIRGVEVPKTALSHDSGSSRRSSQVDTWR
eukprot:1252851-Pyramimonas_sp.AAC.1